MSVLNLMIHIASYVLLTHLHAHMHTTFTYLHMHDQHIHAHIDTPKSNTQLTHVHSPTRLHPHAFTHTPTAAVESVKYTSPHTRLDVWSDLSLVEDLFISYSIVCVALFE